MEVGKGLEREPQRKAVQDALAEAFRGPFPKSNVVAVGRTLPSVLRRHGLGQTLAYMQMRAGSVRGPSVFELFGRHLDRWLLASTGLSGRTALAALATRDSRVYREASEQAWLFLQALREALQEKS